MCSIGNIEEFQPVLKKLKIGNYERQGVEGKCWIPIYIQISGTLCTTCYSIWYIAYVHSIKRIIFVNKSKTHHIMLT